MVTLEQICKRSYYRQRHIQTPLLQERLQYLQYWADQNMSLHTLKSIAQYLLRIVEYLHLEKYRVVTLAEIEKAATRWAKYQYNHPQKKAPFSKTGKTRFTWYAVDWLKKLNRLEPLPEESIPLFNKLFERRHALLRHTTAPLLKERILYLQYWADHGAMDSTLRRIAQYLLVVMDYLKFFKLRMIALNDIEKVAEKWAAQPSVLHRKRSYSKSAKARFIHDACQWLKMLGCFKKQSEPALPFAEQLYHYIDYMRVEQGLSENTISGRFSLLKDFLTNLDETNKTIATLTPLTIDEVLAKKYNADGYSRRSIQHYASVIRSFVRYMEHQGWCQKGLADAVKAPRVYKNESLPSSPWWDDIKKVLAKSKTDKPTDIRDYAILLLLSVYGLRSSEVVHLCLQDLDWENERLYLQRAKRSKPQVFPLSPLVGEAILRYLQEVRPNNYSLKEVFISMRSPFRPLKTAAIYRIVSTKLKPLGLKLKHYGPHALRHGCATHLMNEGISLKEISDHLGHQGLETTRIYTRVDLTSLRKVAELNVEDLL
jgi:integrase/recombinase XerD